MNKKCSLLIVKGQSFNYKWNFILTIAQASDQEQASFLQALTINWIVHAK